MKLLPTQEIGSLAKPAWRVKGYKGTPLSEEEMREARDWAERLGLDADGLEEVLRAPHNPQRAQQIRDWSLRMAVRLLEEVGLDVVFGGEQWRIEMYEHVMREVGGMEFLGHVRSFDNKYFKKAAAMAPVQRTGPICLDEFRAVAEHASRPLKVPLTGPYTLVDWSYNEHYLEGDSAFGAEAKRRGRRRFLEEIVAEVMRPEIDELIAAGAEWIQIDEPALTTDPSDEEMEMAVEALNATTRGFGCRFSLHNCYSDYRVLARFAPRLEDIDHLALEYANRDTTRLGLDDEARPGYLDLRHLEAAGYRGGYGLGVLHVHDWTGPVENGAERRDGGIVELPELVRDRIRYAVEQVGDPGRIWVNPDCGLRTRTWEVTFEKLSNMVQGVELAREAL